MSVQSTCLYDGSVCQRPAFGDLSNGIKVNKNGDNKIDPSHPCAEEDNQKTAVLAAHARVIASAILHIEYDLGDPSISALECVRLAATVDDFTVTDNGVGDITIEWPADFLPTSIIPPYAAIVWQVPGGISAEFVTAQSVRVRTVNMSNVAADLPFVLVIP